MIYTTQELKQTLTDALYALSKVYEDCCRSGMDAETKLGFIKTDVEIFLNKHLEQGKSEGDNNAGI